MRILILSFYYAPDLSAGSFRTTALVKELRRLLGDRAEVDVVTTAPNRYSTFVHDAIDAGADLGLSIHRIRLPNHHSDMLGQSRAFLRFATSAIKYVRDRDYDLVFATSSRLMTAALGSWIARRKQAPLYLDIRDIFVDTIGDVLPRLVRGPATAFFSVIEKWTISRAERVNLVSRGFEPYFRARYRDRKFAWFTNGIDDEFLTAPAVVERIRRDDRIVILYAGNIGEGQCLHEVLPQLAKSLAGRARFVVIGDGGRRSVLERSLAAAGVDNVELRNPVPRAQLIKAYSEADVLFLHLGSHRAFEKVLPSKLFEYAATGKPLLAGVSGYAAQFVREEISNSALFPPSDAARAVSAFETLQLVDRERPEFVAKFSRANIARAMANDIVSVCSEQRQIRRS